MVFINMGNMLCSTHINFVRLYSGQCCGCVKCGEFFSTFCTATKRHKSTVRDDSSFAPLTLIFFSLLKEEHKLKVVNSGSVDTDVGRFHVE